MSIFTEPVLQVDERLQADGEQIAVNKLIKAVAAAGVRAEPSSVVNFYVALKSRPLVILAGPAQTGKIALVRSLAQVLTSDPVWQCPVIIGHARWAARSQDVSFFVEMQARFNRSKLLALIEEALVPDNAQRLFIACLARISPAEVDSYFTMAGFQFWPEQVQGRDSAETVAPIPYPHNVRLIGTMDTDRFKWWDTDLLTRSTIVQWQAETIPPVEHRDRSPAVMVHERIFLRDCVRTEQAAYARLRRILRGRRQAFRPLVQVVDVLGKFGVSLPPMVMNQVMVFLANAWTADGGGLFDHSPQANLHVALDLALAQYALPWVSIARQESQELQRCLLGLLDGRFRRAAAFV
jgi:hypothetical protein